MGCGQALDLLHYVFWPNKWHIVPLKFEIAVTPKSLMIFPSFLASKIMLTSGTRALFGSCNKPSEAWFRRRTFHVPKGWCINYNNVVCKQLDPDNWNEHFSPFELSSDFLNNLGRPWFELGSVHEKFGVWTGGVLPYITYKGMCRPTGSWFWSSWFRTGYPFQRRFLERGIISVSYTHLTLPTNREV